MVQIRLQNTPRIIMGVSAMAISLLLIFEKQSSPAIFIAASYLAAICVIDTFYAKIPNWCNLGLLAGAFIYHFWFTGFPGLGTGVLGFLVGFSLLLIPYLMGGMGGGDVKALGALGALLGPVVILQVFLYVALFGGLFSILHYLFSPNFFARMVGAGRALVIFAGTGDAQVLRPEETEKLRFPYASAIAFGFYSHTQWGSIFSLLKYF